MPWHERAQYIPLTPSSNEAGLWEKGWLQQTEFITLNKYFLIPQLSAVMKSEECQMNQTIGLSHSAVCRNIKLQHTGARDLELPPTRLSQEKRQSIENISSSCHHVNTTWEVTVWSCQSNEPVLMSGNSSLVSVSPGEWVEPVTPRGCRCYVCEPVQESSRQLPAKIWALKARLN